MVRRIPLVWMGRLRSVHRIDWSAAAPLVAGLVLGFALLAYFLPTLLHMTAAVAAVAGPPSARSSRFTPVCPWRDRRPRPAPRRGPGPSVAGPLNP